MQGKKINGYTLQHLLGTGGMAEVWYAENKIGKKAAVKILLPKFCADESIVARFENEAKVMVELEHPNIRQVYDYDMVEGRPCIIMEYLEGNDLKGMMKQSYRFSDDELVKWWNQMVAALNYTHNLGIVHRDIKPSNIFIDKHGNVRLLDFGIAKNNEGGTGTLTGSTLGTRIYMSPEQVKDPKRVDYRTDLYSLAVTFVHLLTGKAPYDSTTSSDFEIQLSIVSKPLDLSGLPEKWRSFLEPYLVKEPINRPVLREYETQTPKPKLDFEDRIEGNEETIIERKQDEFTTRFDEAIKRYNETGELPGELSEPEGIKDSQDLKITFIVDNGYDDKASFVMKHIEGGTFKMGANNNLSKKNALNFDFDADSDESPVHEVAVEDFYLGQFEVTETLYDAIMGYDTTLGSHKALSNLSWNDCQELIRKLNALTGRQFRLPTEAEWEFAARGGNKSKGFKYAGSDKVEEVAWCTENSGFLCHEVGGKKPNELGLYDMSGNLAEWCEDIYGDYQEKKQLNPHGTLTGTYRVLRGGSWGFVAQRCRVTNREYANPDSKSGCYGLRLALSL